MIVMITAMTESLNASTRAVPVSSDRAERCWSFIFLILESHPQLRVACSAGSLEELAASSVEVDVVILDLYLGGDLPSLGAIKSLAADGRVLVMSASTRRDDVLAALRAGADGFLSKQASDDAFVDGVKRGAAGGFYLSSQVADMLQAGLQRGAPNAGGVWLAPREEETLSYIARGFTHAQTARRMGVSQATIDTYAKRIRQKLHLGNKADLTRKAIELGCLNPPGGPHMPAGSPRTRRRCSRSAPRRCYRSPLSAACSRQPGRCQVGAQPAAEAARPGLSVATGKIVLNPYESSQPFGGDGR
jgi:DNA-binding NarL/FixJ family response regulator